MKLFIRTKLIGQIGVLVATAGGTALAAAPSGAEQAPGRCESAPAAPEPAKESTASDPFGPVKLAADALSKLCLSDDQRAAVERIGNDVMPKEQAVSDARQAFLTALAEQLKSGKIDENALKPQIDALVKAREDAAPVLRKGFEDLHGILDSGQRAAFVDAIQTRMKELLDASGGWFDAFARDLDLSSDQKQRLQEVIGIAKTGLKEERQGAVAAFDAFKGDQFSLDKIAPAADVGSRARVHAAGMVDAAKQIAAILRPDQSTKLADAIESKSGEAEPAGNAGQAETQQAVVVRHGSYRAGAVRGWGRGYAGRSASYTSVRTGYRAGYPFVGGYSPGVW